LSSTELEQFQQRLLVAAADAADKYGWEPQVREVLGELGLTLPTRQGYSFEVDVQTPAQDSVATYTVHAFSEEEARERVQELVTADREAKQVRNGRLSSNALYNAERNIGTELRLNS
jgi:hypothetical protein